MACVAIEWCVIDVGFDPLKDKKINVNYMSFYCNRLGGWSEYQHMIAYVLRYWSFWHGMNKRSRDSLRGVVCRFGWGPYRYPHGAVSCSCIFHVRMMNYLNMYAVHILPLILQPRTFKPPQDGVWVYTGCALCRPTVKETANLIIFQLYFFAEKNSSSDRFYLAPEDI